MLFWQILLTINKIGNTHCNASHSSDSKTFWNFGWLFAFVTACFSRKMHHFSSWSDAGTPSPLSPVLLPCDLGCDFGNGSGSVQASVFVFFVSGDLLQKGPKGFAPTQTAAKIWVKCKSLFCFSANHSSSHFVSKQRNKTQGKTSSSPEFVWESRSPSIFFCVVLCWVVGLVEWVSGKKYKGDSKPKYFSMWDWKNFGVENWRPKKGSPSCHEQGIDGMHSLWLKFYPSMLEVPKLFKEGNRGTRISFPTVNSCVHQLMAILSTRMNKLSPAAKKKSGDCTRRRLD